MRIVAISDTHRGHRRVELPEGDVLIHAGDITNRGCPQVLRDFNDWLGELPHRLKIVIAGNHDRCFLNEKAEARDALSNAVYLQDSGLVFEGLRFWGSPWQPEYQAWAFNLPRGQALAEKWSLIPEDTDVLITHGPPFGQGDKTNYGERVGCLALLDRVSVVKPRYHIFGHIHGGVGVTANSHTTFVNASCRPKHQPAVIDWEGGVVQAPGLSEDPGRGVANG